VANISINPIDPDTVTERFPAIRIRQPIGEIYVAKMTSLQIQRITYFDVRRRIQEERDIERYLGIQRPLDDRRVESLKKYVNFADATFPTSIIISVEAEYAKFSDENGLLILSNTRANEDHPDTSICGLCRVIDGQHRIAGLEGFSGSEFDVLVSVFVGSDIADQAYIFATVNLEQNKVNRSLVYDLFELAKIRSPYKTCHNIAVALDRSIDGPFYRRIKRLGVSTEGRSAETLTQATFVNSLIRYISDDPKGDRDILLRGRNLPKLSPSDMKRLCFRNLFIDDDDIKIGKILEEYFNAIRERWPQAWNDITPGLMLNRTNGFRALMRLFGRIYLSITDPGEMVPSRVFLEYFKRVRAESEDFSVERFQPGTGGEAALRHFLEAEMFSFDVSQR